MDIISRLESGLHGLCMLCASSPTWMFLLHNFQVSLSCGSRTHGSLRGPYTVRLVGDDAQTFECQVECARFISSVAGRNSSTLLTGGALGAIEDLLERLAQKHRSAISTPLSDLSVPVPTSSTSEGYSSSNPTRRSRPSLHVRIPSLPCLGEGIERLLGEGGRGGKW